MKIVPICLVLGACANLACSSSDSTANTGTPAADAAPETSPPADTGSETTPQPEAGPDAGPEDGGAEAGGTEQVGGVFAISDSTSVDGGAVGYHRVGAFFVRSTGVDTTITKSTVGPCLLEKIGNGTTPVEKDVSAGAVHIQGGSKVIDLVAKADGTYEPVTADESLWAGGETLTVVADGAGVPSFTTTVLAPSKLTLTAPAVSQGSVEVVRSAPLVATWTGASSGVVVLYFDITTSSEVFAATCTFQADADTATIPAAAFAEFPAGTGFFNFYVMNSSAVSATGWAIRFSASSAIVDPSGGAAIGSATFK
jgi:hypothetical protein